MRILTNTTSPYARIARIALGEKGFDLSGTEIVNPWSDDPGLLALNSAARVPTIETDEGLPITESLLVVLWLERKVPEPSLLPGPLDRTISLAGRAMGVVDAMANIVINRMQVDPNFGEHRVGLKRRRTIVEGMRQLESDPPEYDGGTPSIAVIASVVALDYLALRFPGEPWVEAYPRLEDLRARVADRPAFAATAPSL
ncbi:glutathione S-transferase family protein [Aureimonas phyllosphaerae]|uniref:Glutathione S-transferase n=1 Tax=Aureimonas phyllosphaerae TaxID=1166078 RepID=A0A7W6C0X9_9HYPH|nr:glutathione S-transferase family protein [Aureimonas phyllosphaerae]MBB3936432.1 glutathione S-transferase [Aureimonas phyllosphaerae]MBB3960704.1 glutathione S-transferase [Aureimonas phyllosphaerae]SFF30348.1 glutathione S-transferase [Aureimonas phyllosphaerae]